MTARQERAAKYLGLGMTQTRTAVRIGVNQRTLRRWLTDLPGFRAAVDLARESEGQDVEPRAVLLDLLYSDSEQTRLSAARELIRSEPKVPSSEDDYADLLDPTAYA